MLAVAEPEDQKRHDHGSPADAEEPAEHPGRGPDHGKLREARAADMVGDTRAADSPGGPRERSSPSRAEPGGSALLLDVDGTLAPIVAEPEDAARPRSASGPARASSRAGTRSSPASRGRRALAARRIVGDRLDHLHRQPRRSSCSRPAPTEPRADPALAPLADAVRAFARALRRGARSAGGPARGQGGDLVASTGAAPRTKRPRARRCSAVAAEAERGDWCRTGGGSARDQAAGRCRQGDRGRCRALRPPVARLSTRRRHDRSRRVPQASRAPAEGRLDALCVGVRSAEGPEAIEREADLVVDGPEVLRSCSRP